MEIRDPTRAIKSTINTRLLASSNWRFDSNIANFGEYPIPIRQINCLLINLLSTGLTPDFPFWNWGDSNGEARDIFLAWSNRREGRGREKRREGKKGEGFRSGEAELPIGRENAGAKTPSWSSLSKVLQYYSTEKFSGEKRICKQSRIDGISISVVRHFNAGSRIGEMACMISRSLDMSSPVFG